MNDSAAMQWWQQGQEALAAGDWPRLEGCLRRLLQLVPPQAELFDLLGHALLMQGHYEPGRQALEEALALGAHHFWTPHKLGDAHRGLQRLEAACTAFEQALAWGSDSPLTSRNLLEVLYQRSPQQALNRLAAFEAGSPLAWDTPSPWLEGTRAAALRVTGTELALWLCDRGCPDPAVRAVVWQEALHQLDLSTTHALLRNHRDGRRDGGHDAREGALELRLAALLQLP
jgi:tetratricopeptide (TPR) repeat protein